MALGEPPLFAALRDARNVLIAGAGGGFDVYAGLPPALALHGRGVGVHLANLSFTRLEAVDLDAWLEPGVAATAGPKDYFPSGRRPGGRSATS